MTARETGRVYLDHNASSPIRGQAREAMMAALTLAGNASSIHEEGRAARAIIEDAREKVAVLAGVWPRNVVFTSGGTEANIMALSPGWLKSERPMRLFTSAIEHASVRAGGHFAAPEIEQLAVNAEGVADLEVAKAQLEQWHDATGGAPFMVSLMLANNETGALQPVAAMAELVHEKGGLLHCDAVQAAGKIPVNMAALGADLLSISAHKFGGPKGAGALILRDGLPVAALLKGGGQERGFRAGTENIAAITGFGAAIDAALKEADRIAEIRSFRDRLEAEIMRVSPDAVIFAAGAERLPNTSCFAVPGMQAETLVIGLDLAGIAVSAGSACSSGKVERSHVIEAMGYAPELSAAAIRLSLGWNNGEDDIDRFAAAWKAIYGKFAERRHAA